MAESEQRAREIAWLEYTTVTRPNDDWKEYHSDESQFDVRPLGTEYFGADGEGHIEID